MTKTTKKYLTVLLIILTWPIFYSYLLVPNMSKYKHKNPTYTNFMRYRLKQLKKTGQHQEISYCFVPLQDMPANLIKAVTFAEDGIFYQHHGIDWQAIYQSYKENLKRGKIMHGGSTITMQLCKNMFLYPRKTYFRKLIEMVLAWRMEHALAKNRILELYLNLIEWGQGVFGAENAAQYYFKKNVQDLTEAECAFLAAIIVNPKGYSFERNNPFFEARQKWIYNYLVTGQTTITTNIAEQEVIFRQNYLEFSPTVNPEDLELYFAEALLEEVSQNIRPVSFNIIFDNADELTTSPLAATIDIELDTRNILIGTADRKVSANKEKK